MTLILQQIVLLVILVTQITTTPLKDTNNSNDQDNFGFGFELILHHLDNLQFSYDKLADQYSTLNEQLDAKVIMDEFKFHPMIPIKDCTSAKYSGLHKRVSDQHRYPSAVYCEMESYGGGWLVIQQRFDGSVDFNRDWEEYQEGFGTVGTFTEFWLGLDLIHKITTSRDHELMIELKNDAGNYGFARYSLFKVADESEMYKLEELEGFSGTIEDKMEYHKGQHFSTKNLDNDESNSHCAQWYTGGWWYKKCANSALNGAFDKKAHSGRGIYWTDFADAATFSRMMIRAK